MQEENKEYREAVDTSVSFNAEDDEDENADDAGHQVVDQIPKEGGEPEVRDANTANELDMLGFDCTLLKWKRNKKVVRI